MRPCADLAEFLDAPLGRCIAGRCWLYFYRDERFCGFLVWGRPSESDFERLVQVLKVELGRPAHVSLVDARGVISADAGGFRVLERYVKKHHQALGQAVQKLALVRPDGMLGAMTAGFFGVAPQPYPVGVFDDRAAALEWLGVRDAARALADLSREEASAAGVPPLLRDLRVWLEGHLGEAALPQAAEALATSPRTLQRRLLEHGATFQSEVNRARIEVAKRLLLESDAKLTHVALEVGCAALPTFSALFRRVTGQTPSAWRANHSAVVTVVPASPSAPRPRR